MVSKRDREDDEESVPTAIRTLDVAVHKGTADAKVKALSSIQLLLEPDDEQYSANKELVDSGIVQLLTQLLGDESSHVTRAAARTVELLSRQSPSVVDRLAKGQTLGTFNPVQEALGDRQLVRLLVETVVGGGDAGQSAQSALAALCSFNRSNRLAYLDELVARLLAGDTKAVELIDTLVSGMEVKDDLAVVLDQALMPLIKLVRSGSEAVQAPAAALLATVVEQRPAVADFIRNKGGLEATAQLLRSGKLATADVAVRTLWLLVKDAKTTFATMLDFPAVDLVEPLLHLIKAGHDYNKAASEAAEEGTEVAEAEVDNDDEAALLLKALSGQDAQVRAKVTGATLESQTSCSLM